MLVINWLRGRWRIRAGGYQQRCAQIVNGELEHAAAPDRGCDVWSHMMREFNAEADNLTHMARDTGNLQQVWRMDQRPDVLWGSFDGGRDEKKGAATGWTVWAGIRNIWRYDGLYTDADLDWTKIAQGATARPTSETSTSAELAAAAELAGAITTILEAMPD